MTTQAVIGVDYGTDAVRAVIVDAMDGTILGQADAAYPRWAKGWYCDPEANRFRQHPLDHIECLENAVKKALKAAGPGAAARVKAMAVDATGSTPGPVDRNGVPLALAPEFCEDPDAMFILWKDHTAAREARQITGAAKTWGGQDFTRYSGGSYSAEWFWAKMLHVLRQNPKVREAAFSWVEHCDWVTGLLTGCTDPLTMKRSRCAAGHKAMWHQDFGGLPCQDFLTGVDPLLAGIRDRLFTETHTSVTPAGTLCPAWADKLGLPPSVVVATGIIDAHAGAIGGQISPGAMLKVIGTSTCDLIVAPEDAVGSRTIRGICGQVSGSILPGQVGMEAGQSAFGDIYAWFRDLLLWPADAMADLLPDGEIRQKLADRMIPELARAAAGISPDQSLPLALDWLNGRRTPNADQNLKGALCGLTLGTSAPAIFRALVEATAFGSRCIAEQFQNEGIEIKSIIAVGGVAKKSPFVMEILANVMGMAIKAARSDETCALGAAMTAAVAGGIHATLPGAQDAMGAGFEKEFIPDPDQVAAYDEKYRRYLNLGRFMADAS